jgi:hypothetical protein
MLKKMNKKSINYGLKILTILAFVFIFVPFNQASAQSCFGANSYYYGITCSGTSGGGSSSDYGNNNSYYYNPPVVYQQPVYVAPAPAPVTPTVYSNSSNPVAVVHYTDTVNSKTAVAKATTTTPATSTDSASGLAANAIMGSNSFLPSGLVQWILFAIFILLLVILARRVFGAKDAYNEAPMKHE